MNKMTNPANSNMHPARASNLPSLKPKLQGLADHQQGGKHPDFGGNLIPEHGHRDRKSMLIRA